MTIRSINRPARTLSFPPDTPPGESWVYQIGIPYQVSPTQGALVVNIRLGCSAIIDLEVGSDLFVFDRLEQIAQAKPLPLTRYWVMDHPRRGEKVYMTTMPSLGGFVPLGAKRADGTDHPHAGTGFLLAASHGYPVALEGAKDGHVDMSADIYNRLTLQQLAFDGKTMRITRVEQFDDHELMAGRRVLNFGLTPAIASGDDLAGALSVGTFDKWDSGFARWRRGADGCWRPVEFEMLAPDTLEPSLIRDGDGAMLMAFRGFGKNKQKLHVPVLRSTDEGRTWKQIACEPWRTADTPMMLSRAADGTVFFTTNRFREPAISHHAKREMVMLWPLSADRRELGEPLLVRDGPADFGLSPNPKSVWRVDHPIGAPLRLADGKWHYVLAYRVLDDAEMRTKAAPTAHTGCYVAELVSDGPAKPEWRF